MSKKKTILISVLILVVGGAFTTLVFFTEPEAEKTGASKRTAALVEVTDVAIDSHFPQVVSTGTVLPAKDITLSAQVSGEIIRQYEAFAPGGNVKKGDLLLQIDPADYRNILALRESDLQQAQSNMRIEAGRQDVAKKGYELVASQVGNIDKDLVLREPQYQSVKAQLEAAKAAVEQAKLNLRRTTIRAPFDAQVLSRNVNIGSQVGNNASLGRLVGTDEYWIQVNVPLSKLRWLNFADRNDGKGSLVKLYNEKAWGDGVYREGRLYRLIGSLDNQTRLARVLVSVSDPLGLENDSVPAFILNSFVEARIEARELENVVQLNRDYLREGETVWLMEDGKLHIQPVTVQFEDTEYAYISEGLTDDDQVVITSLATVREGTPLRTK